LGWRWWQGLASKQWFLIGGFWTFLESVLISTWLMSRSPDCQERWKLVICEPAILKKS
jgi:hypothetical protein